MRVTQEGCTLNDRWLAAARRAARAEAEAVKDVSGSIDDSLARAVVLILGSGSKVVVMGVGQYGLCAQLIARCLCDTGTPAVFLHPSEARHGGMGVYSKGDPTVLVSGGGPCDDLMELTPNLRKVDSPIIGILTDPASPLRDVCEVCLDVSPGRGLRRAGVAQGDAGFGLAAAVMGYALAAALAAACKVGLGTPLAGVADI